MEFMTLVRFGPTTEIPRVKQSVDQFRQELQTVGGKLTNTQAILGEYDLICTGEAPQIEHVLKALLSITGQSGWQTRTYPTVPIQTFDQYANEVFAVGAGSAKQHSSASR